MKVHFIAPWFEYYPILCDSLRLQTHQDWTLDLIHDGPIAVQRIGEWQSDPRIKITETLTRYNNWGHSLRVIALDSLDESDCDYLVITNADNYYVPGFIEIMLASAAGHDVAYCDIIHSYEKWNVMHSLLSYGGIDCGCVLAKPSIAKAAGWTTEVSHADWLWINSMMKLTNDFVHVLKPLFIHN